MLKHYINIAIRNLLKYKQQSLISIIGLAIGVTCFAFCSYTLRVSMNWDRNIKDIDRICILYSQSETGPKECYDNYAADALAKDFPEIESTVSYSEIGGYTNKLCEVKTSDSIVNYYHETFMFTNYNFLDFFQIRVVNGDPKVFSQMPDAILLTEKTAYKLFGTIDVIGKSFTDINDFDNKKETFTIQGVIENFPKQSSLERFSGIELNTTNDDICNPNSPMHYQGFCTYVKLKEGVNIKQLNEKLKSYILKYPRWKNEIAELKVQLHPFSKREDLYPKGKYENMSTFFFVIGLLVLLTALFNYVIFIIGRIANRIKECGIRQVNGASGTSLFKLIFTEAAMAFITACLLSYIIAELVMPYINSFDLYFSLDPAYIFWLLVQYSLIGLVGIATICLLVTYKIRKISVIQSLSGNRAIRQNSFLRNSFISVQLIICFLFLGTTWFVKEQSNLMEYQLTNGLSETDKASIFEVSLNGDKFFPVRQEILSKLEQNPQVETISRNGMGFSGAWHLREGKFTWEGISEHEAKATLGHMYTDANYFDLMNLKAINGRLYTLTEVDKAVVNESLAKSLSRNPIGMQISVNYWGKGMTTYLVVGVVPDIINNLYEMNTRPVLPSIYMPFPENNINMSCIVKVKPGHRKEFPDMMKSTLYRYVNPATTIYIHSIKENVAGRLNYEQNIFRMTSIFSVICILISLLGIYASVTLSTEKRKKEVAIRKINGATPGIILSIFYKSSLIQLAVSATIAFPLLGLLLNKWLQNYTNHISISIFPFIILFLLMAIIVALTIIWQLWRIARINPAEVIKSE